MSDMWNKPAQEFTNVSFVTNGIEEGTRPANMPGQTMPRMEVFGQNNNDDLRTIPDTGNGGYEDLSTGELSDDNATMVEDDLIQGKSVRPVVGWFVCTKGADLGKDFHVYGGYNTIGRSDAYAPSAPTVNLTDNHVSRDAAMVLSYDPLYNEYTLSKVVDSETICRYNKKMIHGSIDLKAYDRVTLGKREEVELMFIPLCGEQFQWEEDKEEEK